MISELLRQRDIAAENVEKSVRDFITKCPKEFYPPFSIHVSEDMTALEVLEGVPHIRLWFYQGESDYDSMLIPEHIFEASADVIETYLKAKAEEERLEAEQARKAEQERLKRIQDIWDKAQYERLKKKFG